MSKNLRDALKNAKDEIKELVEQNETEQADDLITEIKQKMDSWLAVQ